EPVSNKMLIGENNASASNRESINGQKSCCKIFLFYLIFLITVILIILALDLNFISIRGYPWRWASWDDIFSPFIQRIYLRGPPPT
ncbi:hypothetical protein ILUMI_11216, partial [Ignelater luminosus]